MNILKYLRNKKDNRRERRLKALILTNLFDPRLYKLQAGLKTFDYTEIAEHFIDQGLASGLIPNKFFDKDYYIQNNKDVRDLGLEPFAHYLDFGWLEGRKINALQVEDLHLLPPVAGNMIENKYRSLERELSRLSDFSELHDLKNDLQNDLSAVRGEVAEKISNLESEVRRAFVFASHVQDEFPKFARPIAEARASSVAMLNKYSVIANEIVRLKSSIESTAESLHSLAHRLSDIKVLEETARSLQDKSDQHEQSINLLTSGRHDQKSTFKRDLFLSSFGSGVFIGKRGDLVSETVRKTGTWDEHIQRFINGLPHGGTAIDVGAHLGSITLSLMRKFDKVIAIEPNNNNFSILKANVELNGCRSVECYNVPLYSTAAELSIARNDEQDVPVPVGSDGHLDLDAANNTGSISFSESGTGEHVHRAMILDDFCDHAVKFIKIDVQGAEAHVLRGGGELIRKHRPIIIFEWEKILSENYGTTFNDLERWFDDFGYDVAQLHKHNDKQFDFVAKPRE